MCLAVPGRVIAVDAGAKRGLRPGESEPGRAEHGLGPLRRLGTVDFQGSRVEVSLAMTPEAAVGDWVLVHAGFAISRLDEADARETWEYLREADIAGCQGEFPGRQSAAGNPERGGAGGELPGSRGAPGRSASS